MGVKQSKRSVDITETSTKGEIEGFGNEGKVEKIIDGVIEKVAANGHVESDLQNGSESHQNGLEPVQNGEVAAVVAAAAEQVMTKESDESVAETTANGQAEINGEVNGDVEKSEEEVKKSDDKKEKKKEKKDKGVKKKFSLRNFSFSKKDKSKPSKDDKSPEKVDETPAENATTNVAETKEDVKGPEAVVEVSKTEDVAEVTITPAPLVKEVSSDAEVPAAVPEKPAEIVNLVKASVEDLPPPLPASPPPGETVDIKMSESPVKIPAGVVDSLTDKLEEVASTVSNALSENMDSAEDILKDAEQIAIETGKQIEEKATSLLKTVEQRAEESMRTAGQKAEEVMGVVENALGLKETVAIEENVSQNVMEEAAPATADAAATDAAIADALAVKAEETVDKVEEGAGECLADLPKDLPKELTETSPEATTPDIPETTAMTLPPPPPTAEVVPAAE